jgi:Tol biopolymer transport system component
MESRVVVYDREKNKLLTCQALDDKQTFTTEPSFSPDGNFLYFTTSKAFDMSKHTKEARYDICRIAFNKEDGTFGIVDTLVKTTLDSMTAAFPRPSYDGKFLLYTRFNYGQFAIWHREADLWMLDLEKNITFPLQKANSGDVDSYHSWSQNSRWIVFASRRDDGFFSRIYIAYINEDGTAEKAFLLPQKSPENNRKLMYSYNVPELSVSKFEVDKGVLEKKTKSGEKLQFGY